MRRLILLALVVSGLSGCGWSSFFVPTSSAPQNSHGCAPCGPALGGGPAPVPRPARGASVLAGTGTLTDNAKDSYVAWGVALVSPTEDSVEVPLPTGSTITDLQVRITTEPGPGASWTFAVDKNGSETSLNCTTAGAATSCNDSSLVRVIRGDKIDLHVTPSRSPALATITWSVKLMP